MAPHHPKLWTNSGAVATRYVNQVVENVTKGKKQGRKEWWMCYLRQRSQEGLSGRHLSRELHEVKEWLLWLFRGKSSRLWDKHKGPAGRYVWLTRKVIGNKVRAVARGQVLSGPAVQGTHSQWHEQLLQGWEEGMAEDMITGKCKG